MKQILRVFDHLFIMKPIRLFLVWSLFLAGYYLQDELYAQTASNGVAAGPVVELIWVGLALTLLMGALFALHQVMDRNEKHRGPFPLIAPGFLTPKSAFIQTVLFLAVALAIAFISSIKIGFIFLMLLLLAGYFYSFSPFRFKDNPIASLLIIGLSSAAIFSAGWFIKGQFDENLIIYLLPYASAMIALHLYASLPDQDESAYEANEKKTFALRFGLATTIYVGLTFEIASLVMSFVLNDELLFYPTFFSLPFYIWAAITIRKIEMVRAVKYPIFVLVMTICFKWGIVNGDQALFLLVAGVYLLSKLYYRVRFGVNYPTLAVDSKQYEK